MRPAQPGGDAICDHPFGARLSEALGYRQLRLAGRRASGTRVITNPLDPGGDEQVEQGHVPAALDGDTFERMPGGGGNFHFGGAFSSPDEGWLEGPVHITTDPEPSRLGLGGPWPVALRAPLADVDRPAARRPGRQPRLGRVAVGQDGHGRRATTPAGAGTREFLLSSSGAAVRSTLRGVAWPEPDRAHAVGDSGAMWLWRARDRAVGARPRRADRLRGQPDGRRVRPRRSAARLRGREGRRDPRLRQELDAGERCRRVTSASTFVDRVRRLRGARRRHVPDHTAGDGPARQRRLGLARRPAGARPAAPGGRGPAPVHRRGAARRRRGRRRSATS